MPSIGARYLSQCTTRQIQCTPKSFIFLQLILIVYYISLAKILSHYFSKGLPCYNSWKCKKTRTKTSIGYAKENDREKREKDIEREGEIREREVKEIKRVKGRGIERESERKKLERKRRFLLQFLVKYPERRSCKQG